MKMSIKKIIAKEGLILLALGGALYLLLSALPKDISAVYPKYRAEFMNGEAYIFDVYPDYNYSAGTKAFVKEIFNPSPKLIEKRLNEIIKRERIKAPLKKLVLINGRQVYLSRLLFFVLSSNFFIKVFAAYLVLLSLRFIIWAGRTLG